MKRHFEMLKSKKTLVCLCTIIFMILLLQTTNNVYGTTKDKTGLKPETEINSKSKTTKIADFLTNIQTDSLKAVFPSEELLEEIIKGNKRVDSNRDFIKQIVDVNNRLDYYDLYIKLAKMEGYVVTSYNDYLKNYLNTDEKVLILRHDIDTKSDATRKMFEIEKKNDVKATYYFRWATFDKKLINEISNADFEIGLHYETIATYCIKNKTRIIKQKDIVKCREILKKEIKEFKAKSGINIETIASHGNPVNREIGITNSVLLIGENYKNYGIIGETYDKDIMKDKIKSYICDGEISSNYGFSYSENPIDSILKSSKVIEFLSHPNHWDYNINSRVKLFMQLEYGELSS
jgi:hypothetical protein